MEDKYIIKKPISKDEYLKLAYSAMIEEFGEKVGKAMWEDEDIKEAIVDDCEYNIPRLGKDRKVPFNIKSCVTSAVTWFA